METENTILSLEHITKIYPGVVALKDVTISFREGEIHALVGENGAGKSTLIKVITGAIHTDGGMITISGKTFSRMTPEHARSMGIEAIYQEYNLVDALTAAENICLGKKYGRLVNFKKMNKIAQEMFDYFNVNIVPSTSVANLTSAKRQIVEIAKAVSKNARILIMDEPTAPLTVTEVDVLMNIIKKLKADGVTIIYISHRLDEIFQICDRVSVFRDGQYIATQKVQDTNRAELIKLMVGREMNETHPQRNTPRGEVVFELRNLTGNAVKNISFKACRGEIVGIGGLVGAGRSEIMRVAYGVERKQWGKILVNGKEARIKNPCDALHFGIGFMPEDRKREGCVLGLSITYNTSLSALNKVGKYGVISKKKETELTEFYKGKLAIQAPSIKQKVLNLSGGNQQKVVMARTLAANPDIIIMDEPTRGIDVGAKQEIYEFMNKLCAEGKCIIIISSDMEELLGMSDRIVIFHEHTLSGEISKKEFDQEYVLHLASGGTSNEFAEWHKKEKE